MITPRRPFVGRDRELALLRDHLGRGGLVVVTGDPGIGKTRLVEELAASAEAAGSVVRWGRCWEGEGAPAFWPWIQIVRAEAEAADPPARADLERVLSELEGRLDETWTRPAFDPASTRFRLFDAITALLRNVATARPLVLVLEDLHWADAPSIVLLQFLVRHAPPAALLVVATYRAVDVGREHPLSGPLGELARHGEPMPLAGLAATDVERYVAETLGRERAGALAGRLHVETEGHPFFLVEMVRLLEGSTTALPSGIPDSIRELIAGRLRQRSPACHRVLSVAAVIGRDFSLAVLQRVPALAEHDVLTLIGEALDARLLVATTGDTDTYRFVHALVREAIYAVLPLAERIRLHRQVGEAIESAAGNDRTTQAAVLAHHFFEAAADGDIEPAVAYGMLAGDRATQALAYESAVGHYERTLQLLERHGPARDTRRCPLLVSLGLARIRAGDPVSAEATFLAAAALARELDRPEDLCHAVLGLGEIERKNERLAPLLEEALAKSAAQDSVLRARLLTLLSVVAYWVQPATRKRELSEAAVAMARRLGSLPTLAYALSSRIVALSGPDDIEERLAASVEMVAAAEQCDDREFAMIGRGWIVADALGLGDAHQARAALAGFAALASASHHPYFVWWLAAFRTMEAIADGRYGDAESLAQQCFALGQRAVAADTTQVFAGHFFVVCFESERHDRLEPIMRGFVDQFPDIPGGRCGLALLYADTGREREANAELDALAPDRFAVLRHQPEWLSSVTVLAVTSAILPNAPYAATLYELLLPYRRRNVVVGMGVLCSGSVAHYLGMLATRLGRYDEAATLFVEALVAQEHIGAFSSCAYTRYESAKLAAMRGAPDDGPRMAALLAAASAYAASHEMRRLERLLGALPRPAVLASEAPTRREATATAGRRALLRKQGDYWRLGWEGSEFQLRHRIGLHYLAALIASPKQEFLAVDLVRMSGDRSPEPAEVENGDLGAGELGRARGLVNADAGPDPRAELAYRGRLEELRAVLAEARRNNDLARIADAERETEVLTHEIARGLGLGRGRDSRSPIERARISATRAIRVAMRLIQENDPAYGRHLAVTIKTGTFCSYQPDPEIVVSWSL